MVGLPTYKERFDWLTAALANSDWSHFQAEMISAHSATVYVVYCVIITVQQELSHPVYKEAPVSNPDPKFL